MAPTLAQRYYYYKYISPYLLLNELVTALLTFYNSCNGYDYNNSCYYSSWDSWGRWVALVCVILFVLFVAILFS